MTIDEVYKIWAPEGGTWSPWVKPVLFAHMRALPPAVETPQPGLDLSWLDGAQRNTAYVVDLPGPASVAFAEELVRLGWRPVPLFNAAPGPQDFGIPLVNVWSIVNSIRDATDQIR